MQFNLTRAGAILVSFLIAGCSGLDRKPVVIGAMYNITGAQENLDRPSSEGARLAVDEINKAKGVLGRPVNLVLLDGQSNPKVIRSEAEKLFDQEPDVAGLIGFSDTDMVEAAAPVAASHNRVFLTSGATSPKLPKTVPIYLFLACFGDNVQAAAGAEWAYETLKARTVVVLFNESTSYTRLLHGYFETRFRELGGEVLVVRPYTHADPKRALSALPPADLIYLAAYPDDVATVIPLLRNAGIQTPILGGDGLDIGEAWNRIPDTRNVYFTTHAYLGADNPDPAVRHFRSIYDGSYPGREPDAFTALGYDTARLLMAAIDTAGNTKPDAVLKALAHTKDFKGVTGTITYRDGSRIPAKSVTVMLVDKGRQTFVANVLPTKIPAP